MPVARARSRLVKLILPIASMIGRASNEVMSIWPTSLDKSSALRVSLTLVRSIRVSVVIACSTGNVPRRRPGSRSLFGGLGPGLRRGTKKLQLQSSRTLALGGGSVERRHRLVVDDL